MDLQPHKLKAFCVLCPNLHDKFSKIVARAIGYIFVFSLYASSFFVNLTNVRKARVLCIYKCCPYFERVVASLGHRTPL